MRGHERFRQWAGNTKEGNMAYLFPELEKAEEIKAGMGKWREAQPLLTHDKSRCGRGKMLLFTHKPLRKTWKYRSGRDRTIPYCEYQANFVRESERGQLQYMKSHGYELVKQSRCKMSLCLHWRKGEQS